jgi:hypothetical protein
VFTAMWLWSNTPINEHGFALVSDVAAGIARYDPELARALIQPCFDDWSWFHETDVKYFACGPLKAAARIDPPWAIDLAKGVLSTNLQGLDGSRAEVVAGTMNAFHEMIVELQHR